MKTCLGICGYLYRSLSGWVQAKRFSRISLSAVMAGLLLTAPAAQAGDTTYKYDALGRVIQVTHSDGSNVIYQYDYAGNRTQVVRSLTTPTTPSLNVTGSTTNLRTLANSNGYTGSPTASYQFVVATGTTIMGAPGGGNAIETGSWPAGVTLTLVINGNVYGGGGTGGRGKCQWEYHTDLNGSAGGHGVNVSAPITVTVNGTLRGGGGGGGGSDVVWDDIYSFCGGGGGGGAPNGGGGAPDGSTGSVAAGGAAGQGEVYSYNWSTGGAGGALANDGGYPVSWSGGGNGGVAGLSVKANGHAVTINGSGSY